MIVVQIIAISACILFSSYKILLPLVRRRPIIIAHQSFTSIVLLLTLIALLLHHYILAIVIAILLIYILLNKVWVVVGISKENIILAAQRAIQGTMTKAELTSSSTAIQFSQPRGTIKIRYLLFIRIFEYRLPTTAKTVLFTNVFQKMIDNYVFHL